MYGIQKAGMLKRISAFLLDFILMAIAATGFAVLVSFITGREKHLDKKNEIKEYYEALYSTEDFEVDTDISRAEFDLLTDEQKAAVNGAKIAMYNNEDFRYASAKHASLVLIMVTFSLLLSYVGLELVVPMLFGNGQTVGKKVFNLGVVHVNAVKLSGVGLFARSILGKYTVETMIPVFLLFMMMSKSGLSELIVLGLLLILEIVAFFINKMNTPIHDVLSHTVCVDMSVQMVYKDEQELIDHKTRLHNELVNGSDDY